MNLQSIIQSIYPPACVMCDGQTATDFGLCGTCWGQTPFINGARCDGCGAPLPGEADLMTTLLCDDCMVIARPWSHGRSALIYKDVARKFVLSLKHGDRTDLVRAAGPWLLRAGADILDPDCVIVPIPLHWQRLLRRRYNQAALLGHAVAALSGSRCLPDALRRTRKTAPLEGHSRDQRFATLAGAITVHPKRGALILGKKVVLVDDVMTSGATFAAATEACLAAGATDVCVLALARVVKDA